MTDYQLHEKYTPEEISRLKIGKKSFERRMFGAYLWLYDDTRQYKFRVINADLVELVDWILLGKATK